MMRSLGPTELLIVAACCLGALLFIAAIVVAVILLNRRQRAQTAPAPDTAFEPAAFPPPEGVFEDAGTDEMGQPIQPAREPPDRDEMGQALQSEPPDEPDEA